ncbi:MAG: VWA domain-containing protein [Bdellovibrionota bacterium]
MSYLNELRTAQYLYPEAFWLLIPSAVFVLATVLRGSRSLFVSVMRLATLALLILALAQPVREQSTEERQLAALLDVSSSVPPSAQRALLKELRPYLSGDTSASVFPFGRAIGKRAVSFGRADLESSSAADLAASNQDIDTGETNIASGIAGALARSESSSLFLLSDGQETVGNALQVAQAAAQRGVKIFPLVPADDVFAKERLSISSVYAPVTVDAGDTMEIRTAVSSSFDHRSSGKVEIWLDSDKLYSSTVEVGAHEEKLISVKAPAAKGGMHRIRAVLKPDQSTAEDLKDNALEQHRWVSVKEKAKILLLSGSKDDERLLKQLITQKGYNLEDITLDGTREVPDSLENITEVILNNVSKRQLPQKFFGSLDAFVKAGGGLLLVGGDHSFGLGGYIDSPLEEMSPLKFVPPQTEKRRLNNAIALVIDKSGSMEEEGKIESAKAAALSSIRSLKDEDFVSVIGFDAGPFVIIDVEPVAQAKLDAERRLRNLTAAGKTNLLPALAVARQRLEKAGTARKHIIVLSDGKFPLSSDAYIAEINNLRNAGISVSAVALGVEADIPFMKILSKYGKGAFYHTLDASQLPSIFVEDIKVSTGEKTLQEGQEMPVGVGPAGVQSTTVDSYPPVLGFVETLPKKGSELELITRKEDHIFPILGSWHYGAGKVIAFTSDANGRWTQPWVRWRDFSTFWSQLIEGIRNRSGSKSGEVDFDLRYSVDRKSILFDLAVFDEKLRTELPPRIVADVTEPGGEQKKVTFQSTKKGRFEARIENGRPGDYKLQIAYGTTKLPDIGITLGGELFGEVQGRGANIALLQNLAYVSGGKINPQPNEVEAVQRISRKKEQLLMPLVLLAFVLLMFEAFLRERGWRFFVPFLRERRQKKEPELQTGIYRKKRAGNR